MNEREKSGIMQTILSYCSPALVILYGAKRGLSSKQLKSASLCVVVPECDKKALLQHLYLELPLDVQITLKLYTLEEWKKLLSDPDSYAAWIAEKGTVLYEA